MGLISPAGENLLDFLELRLVLSTYDGDLRDPLWWPQERPVPMRVARGPLGIPLKHMSIESVMPSYHHILSPLLLLLSSVFPDYLHKCSKIVIDHASSFEDCPVETL